MYVTPFGDRRGTLSAGWASETVVALVGDAKIDATGALPQGARMTFLGLSSAARAGGQPCSSTRSTSTRSTSSRLPATVSFALGWAMRASRLVLEPFQARRLSLPTRPVWEPHPGGDVPGQHRGAGQP
jgi:hypothetical protein